MGKLAQGVPRVYLAAIHVLTLMSKRKRSAQYENTVSLGLCGYVRNCAGNSATWKSCSLAAAAQTLAVRASGPICLGIQRFVLLEFPL